MDIRALIKREVLGQKAYPVEATPCRVKLDANENPLALPPELKERLLARLAGVALNRYPEAGSVELCGRFASALGVGPDQVVLGNGSDELIQVLCTALANPEAAVLIPVPTFAMYRITSLNAGFRVVAVPLDAAFDLDLPAMLARVEAESPALTFLAYPNNPTANCFSAERIEALLKASAGIVVVDEAYFHFAQKTFLPLTARYENLVILRTLSKVGLAALRIGLLVGPPALVHELHKVRLPYNLNSLSQTAAGFYLDEEEAFLRQAEEVRRWREELVAAMRGLPGIRLYPTDANFVFFGCDFEPDRVYRQLVARGILIKWFGGPGPLGRCLRVTVGTREENREFLDSLKDILTE
jgi:histidinol-phosphate aminotransferase